MEVSPTKISGGGGEFARPLLERERELEVVEQALDRLAEGAGSLLLVEGPSGIGKTRLLAEGRELARRRGLLCRFATGGELERELAFGVVSQLLEPVVEGASEEERSRLLAGSARLALIALGRADAERSSFEGDPFAPIHGLYWLLANLADSQPVVLAIDDIHWADAETLRFLDYVARRVADLPVLILASARSGEPDEPDGLERLRLAAQCLRPRALTEAAVREMVAAAFGGAASAEFAAACAEVTAGNPFLVAELLRALRTESFQPDAEAATAIAQLSPGNVARRVLMRLGRFGGDAISLARAVAVLGGSPQVRHVARLSGLEEGRVRELCDRLREAEIFAAGRPIRFVHPLVRSAIYRDLSEEERSQGHRRAAEILRSRGARAADIAPHLLACAPNGDQWVVAQLREAAQETSAARAPDTARSYLERALEEPPDDELPILFALGKVLQENDPLRAPDVLADVAARASDPELRMRALRHVPVAYIASGNVAEAARTSHEALQATPEGDREQSLVLESQLFCLGVVSGGRDAASSERIRAVGVGLEGRTLGERLVHQALAFERFNACEPVEEVVGLAASFPPGSWEFRGIRVVVPAFGGKVLAWSGRWDQAREAIARFTDTGHESGALVTVSTGYGFLAEIDRLSGRLADAEAEARTAWELAKELVPLSPYGWAAIMNLMATLIARGDLQGAARLTEGFDLSSGPTSVPVNPWPLELRAYMRLAEGDLGGAVADLLTFGEALESFGYLNPGLSPWRQEAAPALALLDRTAEAQELVAVAEKRARAFGAAHVLATVLRSNALLQPRERQIETLARSVTMLEASGPPHELARSLVELGAALRRAGRRSDAREPLRRGLDLAHRCGAGSLEARAREELAAAGSRPRRAAVTGVASLTASELRTAKLAVEGLNNREIAERLFVSRRTVETHLTHVYAKLGIAGREHLEAALTADADSVTVG